MTTRSSLSIPHVESAVEVAGSADQRHVGQGLRKVAEMFSARPELLGEEPHVISVADHLLETETRLLQISRS